MLKIKSFTFNPFEENTYIVYDEHGEGVLIDPGCYEPEEERELDKFLQAQHIELTHLLNTHCHVDHVLGNQWAKDKYGLELWIHQNEMPVLKSVEVYAPSYGFTKYQSSVNDHFLEEGQEIKVGTGKLKVIFVPGHAPGHVVFYDKESNQAICGDTLFRRSIGRTDLPGGDHELLLKKIKEELFTLPDETILHPGHGTHTQVAFEKEYNPFVGKQALY